MIKFHCSSCNQKLGVPDDYAGKRIRCGKCGHPSLVPHPEIILAPAESKPQSTAASGALFFSEKQAESSKPAPSPIELQPHSSSFESNNNLPPVDPNAELLRQVAQTRADATKPAAVKAKSEPSPSLERFGPLSKILNPAISMFGSFPFAVITSALVIAIVIVIWNCFSVAFGTPLEIFYIVVAVAAGMGLCVISEHRSTSMGLLAIVMAILAIMTARIVQVHLFVFPEWKKVVSAVEIPPEREKVYLLMGQFMNKLGRRAIWQEVAEKNSDMAAIAICALIQDKQIDPPLGMELYFRSQSQLDHIERPYDPNTNDITFDDPAMSKTSPKVNDKLRQWDNPEKRIQAVGQYYDRHSFFVEQCRYKALLDDYPKAISLAFFTSDGCIFLFLRVVYCIIGLVGAYKTCSESFMD